jgi:hypothetical protein
MTTPEVTREELLRHLEGEFGPRIAGEREAARRRRHDEAIADRQRIGPELAAATQVMHKDVAAADAKVKTIAADAAARIAAAQQAAQEARQRHWSHIAPLEESYKAAERTILSTASPLIVEFGRSLDAADANLRRGGWRNLDDPAAAQSAIRDARGTLDELCLAKMTEEELEQRLLALHKSLEAKTDNG